jgi:YHS domain-containing protein
MSPKRSRKKREDDPGPAADPGQPGGGKGRRDETGRTGIWPMSGPLPPSGDAWTVSQGELGQGTTGVAGYAESGGSEAIVERTDPVCGTHLHPEHAAVTVDWNGTTYFFDSEACRRRFTDEPIRYAGPLARNPGPR